MEEALSVLVGILVATSVYLMLSRNLIRFLFGLVMLGNAANTRNHSSSRAFAELSSLRGIATLAKCHRLSRAGPESCSPRSQVPIVVRRTPCWLT